MSGRDIPVTPFIDVLFCTGGGDWDRIAFFTSRRVELTDREVCSMEIIELDAWSKSLYRSLHFRVIFNA